MENLVKTKKKKFLIIGSGHYLSLERSYLRAFKKLKINKVDFCFLDTGIIFSFLYRYHYFFFNFIYYYLCKNKVEKILKKKEFDYIFIFKGMQFNNKTLKNLQLLQKKAKWINIYTDNPFNFKSRSTSNSNIIDSIKFYDYFCVSFKNSLDKKLKKFKVKKIIFLPFGYDSYKHKINKVIKKKNINKKINFVGSFDLYRKKFLNSLNIEIDVFGAGWNKKHNLNGKLNIHESNISGIKLKKVISSYSISINILRQQDKNSHNMKSFEIPALGGLMLTNFSREQMFFFKNNKECFMYKNKDDFIDKIKYIFSNPTKSYLIRKNGFNKSKLYPYENRLKKILSIIS